MPEEEEDDGAGIAGLPVMLGLARMTLEAIRISGTRRGSEGVAGRGVSQRSGHGGFGHEGKKSRGVRGREQGGKGADEGVPGGVVASLADSGRGGKQEVAGACARASGTRPPAYWQEVEDGGGCGGLGRTVLDQHRSWAGSGGLHR